MREQSFKNFHHHTEWTANQSVKEIAECAGKVVLNEDYKVKLIDKDGETLVSAKQGAANKFGYIFTHSAIVIICIDGMLDSTLPIRLPQWIVNKSQFVGNGVISDISEKHRIGIDNPAFRGNG